MTFVTEDEAKTKWCPMVRLIAGSDTCIGSACMMWQWGDEAMAVLVTARDDFTPADEGWQNVGLDEAFRSIWQRKNEARRGFCGLARTAS